MRALSVNETAILKSRFQAGADGHRQQVTLTAQVTTTSPLDTFQMVRVAVPTSGQPVVLLRARLPTAAGGDNLVHIWAIRYRSQAAIFGPAVRVDVENSVAETADGLSQLGLANLNGTLWALYRAATANRWALRSSADGIAWSAPQTPAPLSAVVPDERSVDLVVAAGVLYLFWTEASGNIKYTTTVDGVTWTATVDTGFGPGVGWGTPSPRFRVAKTDAYWHIVRYERPAISGTIQERRAATPSGWNAAADVLVSNTGSGVFGHEYIAGLDIYARGPAELAVTWADAAESTGGNVVYRTSSTDDGASWASTTEGLADPPALSQPSAARVPAFISIGGVSGQDDAWLVCNDTPNHIHVVTTFAGIRNGVAVYGNGLNTSYAPSTVDVSARVRAISLQKDDEADAGSFNLELQNIDGLLNLSGINAVGGAATLSAYAQPNVQVDIYQWHGVTANRQRTFSGIVDNPQEKSAQQVLLLVGRDQAKKLLTQRVIPIAPQDFSTGYVRDMANYVYLNKTLGEVLDNLLLKGGLDSTATGRTWAASSYVFKELVITSGTLMDAAKLAAQAAGMRFWFDEDRMARTAPAAGPQAASVWTYRAREDLQTFDTDLSDDKTYTRVRVIGKANIGAKYLAEQFIWPAPAPDIRAIAHDQLTGHVWVLCGNRHLYRLDPNANMVIVSDTNLAAWLAYPDSIDVGPDNHLWIVDGYDATLGANANRKFRKVDRAAPGTTLLGPFTTPDQLHVRLWHDQVNRLWMDTYATPAALVKMNDATGAEVSRVTSPVNWPMGFDSDGQGGAWLTGWEQVDVFQIDLAGNIVNTVKQPAKNSNELALDHGDLGLYAVFVEAGTIVKYAIVGAPSGVATATYATAIDVALESQLLGEVRVLDIIDLSITDLAMAASTAIRTLAKVRAYSQRTQAGAIGNPGLQLHDRVTVAAPGSGIAAGDYMVRSIRSDQVADAGTYLMILGLEPYSAAFVGVAPVLPVTPDQIAGLLRWYKADALALADNDPVSTWTDSSGNANATQTGTARPLFKTGILGGLPIVRFDGVNDWMAFTALPSSSGDFTAFFVAKTTGDLVLFGSSVFTAPVSWPAQLRVGESGLDKETTYDGASGIGTTMAVARTSFSVLEYSRTGSTMSFFQNGVADGTATFRAPDEFDEIASTGGGSFVGAGGDIAEIVYYSRALTAPERASIELYLKTKYGL